tara:strand:- start:320 stop:961 length:642 start_codon:yes stop_codon:yes gene_type:complete
VTNNINISIFGNKIFLEILNEIKLFSKFQSKYYENIDLCIKESLELNRLIIFLFTDSNKKDYEKIKSINLPIIVIAKSFTKKFKLFGDFMEKINMPFSIIDFQKKLVLLAAKYEFKKNSIIYLNDYIIDKNERKIKKQEIELQLSEKEINFLILFSKNKKPISRKAVLESVWKYSSETETHTVETHIHRLRKKIMEKFNDKNFIKNNNEGYYI